MLRNSFSLPPTLASQVLQSNGLGGMAFSGMKKPDAPQDEDAIAFGNWTNEGTGAISSDVAAKDLSDRGLVGMGVGQPPAAVADKKGNILNTKPIVNSQAAWSSDLVSEILRNAYKMKIRKPEEVEANKNVLVQSPKLKEIVNHWAFKQKYPNFWEIVKRSILPQQWKRFDEGSLAKNKSNEKPSEMGEKVKQLYDKTKLLTKK